MVIAGTGCALADYLYTNVRFNDPSFSSYLSGIQGDGGLSPGRLVFTEELERFSGKSYAAILKEITGGRLPDGINIGGPGLVSLIHASQILDDKDFDVLFYGCMGDDRTAGLITSRISQTPLNISHYQRTSNKPTPFTDVFSDPTYDHGNGERTFVNNIGAARDYLPGMLPEEFFRAEIVCFGGTALVPNIHADLTALLYRAEQNQCIKVVNTVFDFESERKNPGKPWPLVRDAESFRLIDVLIMDLEEALKISGQSTTDEAIDFFRKRKVSSVLITNGSKDISVGSDGRIFDKTGSAKFPVSRKVTDELRKNGDTTGCGDNFAGGIIASLAMQVLSKGKPPYRLDEAVTLAVASGGFTCSYLGGTYLERYKKEKLEKIQEFVEDYREQLKHHEPDLSQ